MTPAGRWDSLASSPIWPYAYLADVFVFVVADRRGCGLADWLVESVLHHPRLQPTHDRSDPRADLLIRALISQYFA